MVFKVSLDCYFIFCKILVLYNFYATSEVDEASLHKT